MSKITFRADDDLVKRLEEFDSSKSEVMREALRQYLDTSDPAPAQAPADDPRQTQPELEATLDDLVAARVDALIEERLDALVEDRLGSLRRSAQDVNVNITLDGDGVRSHSTPPKAPESESLETTGDSCVQCGESLAGDHVYCPNCGEKATHRVFCDCGDEVRSDWAFCPSCGRRTPAADVLDQS